MGTNDALLRSVQHTQQELAERFESARGAAAGHDAPRRDYERIDVFLSAASKHLHAVDAALLPTARKQLPDGGNLVHDYLRSAKALEVVLAHVKAHEYGSVYETAYAWPGVWSDVREAMWDQGRHEQVLAQQLTESLDDAQCDRLVERLHASELVAPSRPHPYIPHVGLLGLVSRRVMHVADSLWDTVEGRMVPQPERHQKKPPGRLAQYVLGDPRFDEE